MRVGVLGKCQYSMFSGSQANATLAVAEVFKVAGHTVDIVSVNGEATWWDDIKHLEKDWSGNVIPWSQIERGPHEPYDLMLEVGHMLDTEAQRRKVAKKSVLVIRKPAAMDEIEHCLFPTSNQTRCWDGISEIWAFDQYCTDDDVQILETLSRKPVYKVPFLWTPSIVEKHREEMQSPLWIQMTHSYLTQEKLEIAPWSLHIAETNTTSMSSCTIPMLIVRETALAKKSKFSRLRIHNAEHVFKSKFFQENVWRHARVDDLSGEFLGRQRAVDWVFEPMSLVVTHQRFTTLRPMLLDIAWVGIPFLHNSKVIAGLGKGLERAYYQDNRISEGVEALGRIQEDLVGRKGYFTVESLNGIRHAILETFSPFSNRVQAFWKQRTETLLGSVAIVAPVAKPEPAPVAKPEPAPVAKPEPEPVAKPAAPKKSLTIGFSDMWDSFNPEYNFFTLLLQEAASHLSPPVKVKGVSIEPGSPNPDLLVFGPFGDTWRQFPITVPKVHFTGENTPLIDASGVKLNLGFPHQDMAKEDYLRFPLWILEIDWFGADPERIVNPKPIPVDRCTKVYPEEMERHKKFCAFVVSNPNNPLRNAAYHWLNSYKTVDSAGRLFNTMGDILAAGPGGGGGELKKFEFFKDYKFALTYENNSSQGYVTEKLLHAKAAGCIPIYWGDPKVNRDFDTRGFLSAEHLHSPAELIEAVKRIDEDDALWKQMYMTPALDEYKLEWTRRTLSECAQRLLKLATGSTEDLPIPKFLGAKTTEEADAMGRKREASSASASTPPILATFVTRRFLPSLQLWLNAVNAQTRAVPGIDARIYYGPDVPQESIATLLKSYTFASATPIPSETPVDFPDLWEPQHFAWKIWIYKTLATDPALAGRMILYMDAGCFMSRWPVAWLKAATANDICFLEDPRQTNLQWCHEAFCSALAVTESEKSANQIVAGILAFRAGADVPVALFTEAWKWAQNRPVICGEKWSGTGPDGKPRGHRHDQSILSILRLRYGCATFPLDDVYCDVSLRRTFQTGKSVYCHRGLFKLNAPFTQGIDDCYVINLDRRTDRMDRLFTNSPELKDRVTRISAYEGRAITLTPALARLFKPHDFFWKKAVMGCALSHLSLWWKLVNEHPEIQTFLILEDDVKFKPEWEARWKAAVPSLPEDWDIVYLGGILPPNREAFEHTKERVNAHFSRVAENSIFGQNPPNRYFHWCAYAYVLSRRGAEKVLEILKGHDGYWTSADHMLCNPIDHLRMYFLDPLVAGCYQDDDPKYATSAFNDFSRVDSFDSDLWNNDERFSQEEVEKCLAAAGEDDIDIPKCLVEARPPPVVVAQPTQPSKSPIHAPLKKPPTGLPRKVLCLKEHGLDIHLLHEKDWILELFGKPEFLEIEKFDAATYLPGEGENPIVFVQRPFTERYAAVFEKWAAAGRTFSVFHLSDEHLTDPISFYSLPQCLQIVRMYDRRDIPADVRSKVHIVPLGYHWTLRGGGCPAPFERTPRLPFRNTLWSFYGTAWQGRAEKMAALMPLEPHRCKFFAGWNAAEMVGREEYIGSLLDTVFVPCPGGQNPETYRLYEALECGCVPIVVREGGDTNSEYLKFLTENLQLLPVSSWEEAATLMRQLFQEKNLLETYRQNLLVRYRIWKENLAKEVKAALCL